MESKTFCILPWIHFYANPDGNVLPCCIGDYRYPLGNIQNDSITDIWNNERYRFIRKQMLSGERCVECNACYQNEDAGVSSFRQSVNNEYSEYLKFANETEEDGSLQEMKLKYLDIRWSNICNFKCRSCSSTYSSSWATEDNKQGQDKKVFIFAGGSDNDRLYEQLKPYFSDIKEIYFAGGEPLLMDKHYEILNYLKEIGNTDIKIRYNSNLSSLSYKDTSVIELWKNFSNIHLNISLDSWGDRAEYIREGTDWSTIENNIRKVKSNCPHISFGIASVISVFNVSTIPDFINYLIDSKLVDSRTSSNFYCLINPKFYSFDVFDDYYKNKIIDSLLNTKYPAHVKSQIDDIIKHIKNSKFDLNLQKQFKKNTEYYDKIRNKNFVETFPELKNFYEAIL